MKYIKKFKIFESVQSYQWNFIGQDGPYCVYYFDDDFGNQFRVEIERHPENEIEIRYLTRENDKWSYKEVKTNIWRITETVIGEILKDFLSKNDWVQSIKIVGLGKIVENDPITQRTKLYWRYLKNNPMVGWELDKYGNEIYLDKI